MIYIKKIVITITILLLVSCGGAEDRIENYLDKAKQSLSENDTVKAKIDIQNVMQINPKNPEAYYLLAVIAEDSKDYKKAFGLFLKAVELDETNVDARYHLGRFYMQLGERDKTQIEADKINSQIPNHINARSLYAALLYNEKKYFEVNEIISNINPAELKPEIYELYSASLYRLNKTDEALEALKEGIAKYPEHVVFRVRLAKFYEELGDKESATKVYEGLIAMDPKNIEYYAVLSAFHEKNGDLEKAESVFRGIVRDSPDNEEYKLLLFQYLMAKVSVEAGTEYIKTIAELEPNIEIYSITQARLHLRFNRKAEARNIVDTVIQNNISVKGVTNAKNLLAEILIDDKKYLEAEGVLKEVLTESPNNVDANLILGKLYVSRNQADDAVNPLRVVIKEMPENGDVYLLLAKAHQMQGNSDLVLNVLQRGLFADGDNINLIKNYVTILINKEDYSYALNLLNKINPKKKDDFIEISKLKSDIYIKDGKPEEAHKIGKMLVKSNEKHESGYVIQVAAYTSQKKLDAASELARSGFEVTSSPRLLIAYIDSELKQKKIDDAIKYVSEVSVLQPVVNNLLGELYRYKGDVSQSIKFYRKAIEIKPGWDMPYLALASFQTSLKKFDDAIETYKQALGNLKVTLKVRFLMATTYQIKGDIKKSIEMYKSIVNDDPSNSIATNNLAQLLVDEFDDNNSHVLALELVEKIKDETRNTAMQDTVGWVYSRNGKHDEAIEVLSAIVKQRPDIAIFKYHLGVAYNRKGDNADAMQYLNEALSMTSKESWYQDAKNIVDSMSK